MNKTALVTLWVDPAEHQIVKYTFDNVWLDFLPGGLARQDRRHACVDDDGPAVPGRVAAARDEHSRRRHTRQRVLRSRYAARFANYSRPTSRRASGFRRSAGPAGKTVSRCRRRLSRTADRGRPVRSGREPAGRSHRRDSRARQRRPADDEVLKIAGVAVGPPLAADGDRSHRTAPQGSGRFETVEVRKRYRSLTDPPTSRWCSSSTSGRAHVGPSTSGRRSFGWATVEEQADVPADPLLRGRLRLHLRRAGQHDGSARRRRAPLGAADVGRHAARRARSSNGRSRAVR